MTCWTDPGVHSALSVRIYSNVLWMRAAYSSLKRLKNGCLFCLSPRLVDGCQWSTSSEVSHTSYGLARSNEKPPSQWISRSGSARSISISSSCFPPLLVSSPLFSTVQVRVSYLAKTLTHPFKKVWVCLQNTKGLVFYYVLCDIMSGVFQNKSIRFYKITPIKL